MLGFDALGKLALGQLPSVPAQTPQTSFSFGYNFSQPRYTARVPLEGAIDFRILRPDAATPKELVFTKFSEPDLSKKTSVQAHTSPIFRILRPDAATTGPLVFNKFSEPQFSRTYPAYLNPEPRFGIFPTTTPMVFSRFSEPSKVTFKSTDVTNTPVVPTSVVGIFSKFSEPSKVPFKSSDVSNTPVVTTPVVVVTGGPFSTFSEPSKVTLKTSDVTNVPVFITPVATVVTGGDFATFDLIKTKPVLQGSFTNSPIVLPVQPYVFGTFGQPSTKNVPQADKLFVGDLGPAKTPDRLAFADFEGIPSRRPLEGYITSTSPPTVQNYVFSKFEQPFTKRILHPDQSFVNFPVVVAAVQPYVFSDFGQPWQTKRPVTDDRSFLNFPVVVVQQQPYIFTPFEQPRPTRPVTLAGFTNNTPEFVQAVVQNYTFGLFSQPQLIRPRVDGFTNTPDFLTTQPYVFTSFDQPRQSKLIVPGFTNNLAFIAPQFYVFSRFEQPISQRQLQIDSVQFVANTPTVVVLTPDFSYSDFGLPFYTKQTGISFTNSPLQPIIAPDNSAPFNGFCSFILNLPGRFSVEQHPGVAFEILVPEVVVEGFAGKYWKVKPYVAPKAIQVESSTISEVVFDKASNELKVKFNSGREYNYTNISEAKVKGLVKAKSSGKYLHNNIKGKYFTTRMK